MGPLPTPSGDPLLSKPVLHERYCSDALSRQGAESWVSCLDLQAVLHASEASRPLSTSVIPRP
ncbi:hypothetical protein BD309DRAFT_855234 [Dichomitus squalens]|uniref:Uncharacterized protein n=1 Tax=Dichomitus squalens TaxID=114155 RepID=A0A4Q9Q4V2_9APHY